MAHYVDGFVVPVPKGKLEAYRHMAEECGKIWKEHGALEFRECVGEDLKTTWGVPFTKIIKLKPGETVMFSFIVYRSRAHRDRVNAKVMKDERLTKQMAKAKMPFDVKRMVFGGFETLVDL